MANFIQSLQAENKGLKENRENTINEINNFLEHLNSPKFQGFEGGERKDWIATADVRVRLMELKRNLFGQA